MNLDIIKSTTFESLLDEIIIKNKETDPFYIVNINDIYNQHQRWQTNLPNIKPYYAVKSNNEQIILDTLNNLNLNYDCASLDEIKQVLSMNVHPSRIIWSHPCKPITHLKYASQVGVDLMTFDSIEELEKVKEYHCNPKLVIRVYVDDSTCVFKLNNKFGVQRCDIEELLIRSREMELDVVGVSFHVGSGTSDASCFYNALECARYTFDLGKSIGYNFYLLDIGGGFPNVKKHNVEFEDMCGYIHKGLEEYFKDLPNLEIIAEPGQYFSTGPYYLIANITSKKTLKDGKRMYYINSSVFNSMNVIYEPESLYFPQFYIKEGNEYRLLSKEHLEKHGKQFYESKIWGPTCDSYDIFYESVKLPEMSLTDWIVYPNMGSYTIVLSSNFNGFAKPKHYYAKIINF
jgi:ornithine decarboxylase